MNPRTTLVLVVVAALLGGFIYFYEIRGEVERKQAEAEANRVFPGLAASDVTWLELRSSDGKDVRLEHSGDVWHVVRPLEGKADDSTADAIANLVTSLEVKGKVDAVEEPASFGLGKDAREVRFEADGKDYALRIGRTTPVGGNTYVNGGPAETLEAGKEVDFVPTFRLNALNKTLDELRDRRVLRFDRERVESISLTWPGGGVRLAKSGDSWVVADPISDRADDSTVRDLLSDLSFLRADGFADADDPTTKAGLAAPAFQARLALAATEGAKSETIEFVMGANQEGQRIVHGTGDTYFRVPAERLDDFKTQVVDYRYKQVSLFDVSAAHRLELRFAVAQGKGDDGTPDKSIHVVEVRQGDLGWTSSPDPVLPDVLSSLVAELASLRGTGIAAESAGEQELAHFGFDPPRVHIVVYGDPESKDPDVTRDPDTGDPILADLQIGRSDPKLGLLARRAGRDTIYQLDPAIASEIPTDWSAFESDFIAKKAEGSGDEAAADSSATAAESVDPSGAFGDPAADSP